MMMRYCLIAGLVLLAGVGCSKNDDKPMPEAPPHVYKQNAYELNLLTQRLPDGRRVFILNKTLYLNGQVTRHSIAAVDTLPALGRDSGLYVDVDENGDRSTQYLNTDKEYDVLFKVDTLKYFSPGSYSWDTAAVKPKDSTARVSTTHVKKK